MAKAAIYIPEPEMIGIYIFANMCLCGSIHCSDVVIRIWAFVRDLIIDFNNILSTGITTITAIYLLLSKDLNAIRMYLYMYDAFIKF